MQEFQNEGENMDNEINTVEATEPIDRTPTVSELPVEPETTFKTLEDNKVTIPTKDEVKIKLLQIPEQMRIEGKRYTAALKRQDYLKAKLSEIYDRKFSEVSLEKDGDQKPRFTNEKSREKETSSRLFADEEYIKLKDEEFEVKDKKDDATRELNYLKYLHGSYCKLAELI